MLNKLLRNENVSRWDIYDQRFNIRRLVEKEGPYQELQDEVELIIELAEESL